MNRNALLGIVGIALVVYGLMGNHTSDPEPDVPPKPETKLGRRILDAFRKTDRRDEARSHARGLRALCRSLAAQIKYDGVLQRPRLRLGIHFDDLRRYAREYQFEGIALGGLYPDLKPALDEHFTAAVGNSGGAVDDDKRSRWATAFDELSDACDYAAENL